MATLYSPLNTAEVLASTRANQPNPQDMQAGGGFTQQELQATATNMNREEMSVNLDAMKRLEELRSQRAAQDQVKAAQNDQRMVQIQTAAAQVAQANYRQQQQLNPAQQMEAFRLQQAQTNEMMGQMGRKGGYRQYDPIMGTFKEGQPSGFDAALGGRVAQIKQEAGIGTFGQRTVTPIFETPEYLGKAGYAAAVSAKPKMTGEQLMATQEAPMDSQLQSAILASPGGQAALADYQNRTARVVNKVQNELVNLKDEFGMVDPKKLADFAASLPDFTPSMAADVKRSIGVIDATVNQNALEVQRFKQQVKTWETNVQKTATAEDQAMMSSFGQVAAKFQKPETMPADTKRLLDGGMTQSELLTREFRTSVVNPIDQSNYKAANVRNVARSVFGEDAQLDTIESASELVEDRSIVERSIDDAMGEAYNQARTGSGDIRSTITATISKQIGIEKMSEAEGMYYISQIWDKADQYVGKQIDDRSSAIRTEQTSAIRSRISSLAGGIALQAAQFSPALFEDTFKSASFKAADKDKTKQGLSLGGAFADKLRVDTEQLFANADQNQIADLQETYTTYLNTINTAGEKALAQEDPAFASIVQARDVYVQAGLAMAESNQTESEKAISNAMSDRQARAIMQGGRDNYATVQVGTSAINVPKPATEDYKTANAAYVLTTYADNWFVQDVIKNNSNGTFLSESGFDQIANMRQPPSASVKALYGEKAQMGIATSLSTMPIGDKTRQIVESTDLSAVPYGTAPAYTESEYSTLITPLFQPLSEPFTGKGPVDGSTKAISQAQHYDNVLSKIDEENAKTLSRSDAYDKGTIPSISSIIKNDALLNNMYFNGETPEARQRAVAAALVKQRTSVQTRAIVEVAGAVNPVDRKATQNSMKQELDKIHAAVGGTIPQSDIIDDINRATQTAKRSTQMASFDQPDGIDDQMRRIEGDYNIGVLRNQLERFDAAMDQAGKLYGDEYSNVESVPANIVKDIAGTSLGSPSADVAYLDITEVVESIRQIVTAYDRLEEARNNSVNDIRAKMMRQPSPYAAETRLPIGMGGVR